jgi:hypothetical protein
LRCPSREVASRCSVGRSSHRPVTHRAQPAAVAGKPTSAIARHPQYAVPPGRSLSWRSTPTMNPPLAKPEPASLFRGPRSGNMQNQFARIFSSRAQSTQPRPASRMRVVPRAGDACSVRCAALQGSQLPARTKSDRPTLHHPDYRVGYPIPHTLYQSRF